MPKNRFIYFGILVVAATALLWLGHYIMQMAFYALPATGSIGVLMILIGIFMEAKKSKQADQDNITPPSP